MTCANIISTSPKVVYFACAGFTFDVVSDETDSQLKHCELIFEEREVDPHPSQMYLDCIQLLASSRSHPIERLDCNDAILNNEDLLTVVSVLGKDLKSLIIELNGAVDDDSIVQQITLLCPRLEVLYLNSTDFITDIS